VIAYHAALQFHGCAHSLSRRVTYLTCTRAKPFEFRGSEFVPVPVPPALRQLPDQGGGFVEVARGGLPVRVTTLERTLVDVLDAPRHGGGWEEIWRSLESVEFFDVDAVTDYALKLGSAVAVAKVGFFLEQHREELMLEDKHLERLQAHAPAQAMYLERSKRESGKLLTRWTTLPVNTASAERNPCTHGVSSHKQAAARSCSEQTRLRKRTRRPGQRRGTRCLPRSADARIGLPRRPRRDELPRWSRGVFPRGKSPSGSTISVWRAIAGEADHDGVCSATPNERRAGKRTTARIGHLARGTPDRSRRMPQHTTHSARGSTPQPPHPLSHPLISRTAVDRRRER
jgi:hypothetical protein